MATAQPVTELDSRFSDPNASATDWAEARSRLAAAELYWVTTVRPDGRPHVTPLLAVWLDDAMYFCTGPTEQKARNLETNTHCTLITGCNALNNGLDLVVEGDAVRVTDNGRLQRLADEYVTKYGRTWQFTVGDGAFVHPSGQSEALVFEVAPDKVLGFSKGDFSQTRWVFGRRSG